MRVRRGFAVYPDSADQQDSGHAVTELRTQPRSNLAHVGRTHNYYRTSDETRGVDFTAMKAGLIFERAILHEGSRCHVYAIERVPQVRM